MSKTSGEDGLSVNSSDTNTTRYTCFQLIKKLVLQSCIFFCISGEVIYSPLWKILFVALNVYRNMKILVTLPPSYVLGMNVMGITLINTVSACLGAVLFKGDMGNRQIHKIF